MKVTLATFVVILYLQQTLAAAIEIRTVAVTGHASPGASGAVFGSFVDDPLLNNVGQIAFRATLLNGVGGVTANNDDGVWADRAGALGLIAREGNPAPGTVSTNFSTIVSLAFNDVGQTAIVAALRLSSGVIPPNNLGIWTERNGALNLVAREDDQAPGTPSGAKFGNFSSNFTVPRLNSSGQTVFIADLKPGFGGVVNNVNDFGIWSDTSGSLSLVARGGSQAPGVPAGANFASFFFQQTNKPVINEQGKIAFWGGLDYFSGGGGVTQQNYEGIWSDVTGSLELITRTGNAAPGMPSGATFRDLNRPRLNDANQIAFAGAALGGGNTGANDGGIWSDRNGTLELIYREGTQAPGTPAGAVFFGLASLSSSVTRFNNAGQLAFVSGLRPGFGGVDTNNDSGIWSERNGVLELIAREGDQAPGTPVGASFSSLDIPTLNHLGQIAFTAALKIGVGGVTDANDRGLWGQDATGGLQLIVREGDLMRVAPGDFRTISSFIFYEGSVDDDDRGIGINDLGQVAFRASFTDGSSGVFVATIAVPEPSAALIASILIFFLMIVKLRAC
jgi:hypothetical protein